MDILGVIISWSPMVISWLIFVYSVRKEMRRFRNSVFLFIAVMTTLFSLSLLAGDYWDQVLLLTTLLLVLAILIVPFFLVINGIMMIKREGFSFANILSLLFGLLIGAGEIATGLFVLRYFKMPDIPTWKTLLVGSFGVSVFYVSVIFLCFMFFSFYLMLIPKKKDFDYIIIHGCGLIDGEKVSKLLQERLDKAIKLYRKDPTPPIMIPSGGQGSDENLSEGEAMKNYLLSQGIPESDILVEDKSMDTMENLKNTREIIQKRPGRKYIALVSSNYHIYRCLYYSRLLKFDCTGVGAVCASYYWPSAMIREFAALILEKQHLLKFILGWLASLILFLTAFVNSI